MKINMNISKERIEVVMQIGEEEFSFSVPRPHAISDDEFKKEFEIMKSFSGNDDD